MPPHLPPDKPSSSLLGGLPLGPEDLYRLHRLCLRIYGLMSRDAPAQAKALVKSAGPSLRKKDRETLTRTVEEELPVVIALYALDRLAKDPRLDGEGLGELLRGLLLPCFSLSFVKLYDQPADPLKHVLGRVDWYLDGDKGEPAAALIHFLTTLMGDRLGNPAKLEKHLTEVFFPEMDARMELAFQYEFHSPAL